MQDKLRNHTTDPDPAPERSRLKGTLKKKFILGIVIIIVPALGCLFTWLSIKLQAQAREETLGKARVVADQIILTRQWITDCMGGVFVHTKSPGARDVTYATTDKIITPHGSYRLFTPSMVTQKLSQYSSREKSYRFRLTSLNPINAQNKPDPFEAQGLALFNRGGQKEYFVFSKTDLDYMVPLHKSRGCLKCHAQDNMAKAGIIGGLRITVPFEQTRKIFRKNQMLLGLTGLIITLVTIAVLVVLVRRMILTPLEKLEEKSRQLAAGNLVSRVSLDTGDELERLGTSFNTMAESLMHHRDELEQKVARATHDLAQANQELLKLDKLKSDFLANMSHELRSPLTAIQGSIDYMKRAGKEATPLDYLMIMEKNVGRLTRLIANLFDFTKLEAGKIDWEFECGDMAQLAREVVEIMEPVAQDRNICLIAQAPKTVPAVMDLERMEQVLVNLVDNAIKYSDDQTSVTVQVDDQGDEVKICVINQGPPIAPEEQKAVFEKFYSGTLPVSGKTSKGAGMGLAISKAIVNAHGGMIFVECKNHITRFCIHLPKETHDIACGKNNSHH